MSAAVLPKRLESVDTANLLSTGITDAMERKVAIIARLPGGAPDRLVQRLLRDRFVVLIGDTRTMEDAEAIAERLRSSFDVTVALQADEGFDGISHGTALGAVSA